MGQSDGPFPPLRRPFLQIRTLLRIFIASGARLMRQKHHYVSTFKTARSLEECMTQATETQQAPEKAAASPAKSYYVLTLMTLVWAFQFANIQIIPIVLEDIKHEFNASDKMMGIIAGIAVVLFGAILSMPVARFADRKGRVSIIAIGVAFWSLMTTLGGFAQSIVQLVLSRIGYSIGGSVSPAPANSLVADYFPKNRLPMALAIMSMAPCIGGLAAAWIGGLAFWIGARSSWAWRGAIIGAAIPGFIIAALLFFTVKEPVRGIQDGKQADTREYGIGETLRFFIENKTYFLIVIGFTFTGGADFGLATWLVPYLERVHARSVLEARTFAGTLTAIAGIIGVLLGGAIITWLGKKNDRWKIVGPGIASFLAGPVLVIFLFIPMPWMYIALFCAMILMAFRMGPVLSLVQSVVKIRMRAFAVSILFMIGTVIGSGGAPYLVGAINDYLSPAYGQMAIRYSLLCVPILSMIAALFFIVAGKFVKEDIGKNMADGI
jgi:MFS family permease